MPGLFSFISVNKDYEFNTEDWEPNNSDSYRLISDNCIIEQRSNSKFGRHKFLSEDNDILIAMDGIILEIEGHKSLEQNHLFSTLKKLYTESQELFIRQIKGDFVVLIHDKRKNLWLLYTDRTASKPMYFYSHNGLWIFGSEIKFITAVLRKMKQPFGLDITSAYYLLTLGHQIKDFTMVQEIRKLQAGHYLKIDSGKVTIQPYHRLSHDVILPAKVPDIVEELDFLFLKSLKLAFMVDNRFGYKHLCTLSGGLDSRMVVMQAYQQGYGPNMLNICFSESGYWDEAIAKNISNDLKIKYLFYSLSGGQYLEDTEYYVNACEGQVLFPGLAPMLSLFRFLSLETFGILHSGQLGDAVLGSYLARSSHSKANAASLPRVSDKYFCRIEDVIGKSAKEYESEEIFKMYNRGFSRILNGNHATQHFTETLSPFLFSDVLDFCFRIPPNLKFNNLIYQEWIRRKRPALNHYIWETTKRKPLNTRQFKEFLGIKTPMRLQKILSIPATIWLRERYGIKSSHMTPFETWYAQNNLLKTVINKKVTQLIDVLDEHKDLKSDAEHLFRTGSVLEKMQVITLLEAYKLLFL